jgi:hypothetical protein
MNFNKIFLFFKTFADTIESVIEYLDQHPTKPTATTNEEVVKHSHGLKEKWNNTLAILKEKGVKEDLKVCSKLKN